MKGLFLPAAALILSLRAPAAYGTTYYVATTGNDANDGLSAQSAFLTLAGGRYASAGGASAFDLSLEHPRRIGSRVDIGCFEANAAGTVFIVK